MISSVENPVQQNGPTSELVSDDKQDPTGQDSETNNHAQGEGSSAEVSNVPASCIRVGCQNPPVVNSEWEDEYCSNECVVSHCKDVFSGWVTSNQNSVK